MICSNFDNRVHLCKYQILISAMLKKVIIKFSYIFLFQLKFQKRKSMSSTLTNNLIGGKYRVGPIIGAGSFGQVYLATNEDSGQIFALKKEDDKIKHSQLTNQNKIIKIMGQYVGFPRIQWFGCQNKSNVVVMELLGPSLQDLFGMCNKKFRLKTVLMLGDQMIQKMELLHAKNYIHRDIKPQNFLMGIGKNSHILHCIDFGLSKKYRDLKTHQHVPYKENRSLTGTARYSSINAHLGIQQSRRDDLQSIGYVLIYFLQGSLPWQGIRANNKIEKYQKIMEKKMSIPVQVLCKGLPIQFSTYMNHCKTLKFQQKPDYNYLRRMFRDLFQKIGFQLDFQYDWTQCEASIEYQTSKIKLQVLKKNQQIPLNEIVSANNKSIAPKIKFDDCIEAEEIEVDLISGQENVDEDLLEESNSNFLKLYTNDNKAFLSSKNKDLTWE